MTVSRVRRCALRRVAATSALLLAALGNAPGFFIAGNPAAEGSAAIAGDQGIAKPAGDQPDAAVTRAGQSNKLPFNSDGPKYLQLLLAPHQNSKLGRLLAESQLKAGVRRALKKGAWLPIDGLPRKLIALSGETDDLVDTVSELFPDPENSVRFLIPHAMTGALIGENDSKIKAFQEEHSSRVMIDIKELTRSLDDLVRVRGDSDAVKAAAKWIIDEQSPYAEEFTCGLDRQDHYREAGLQSEIFMKLSHQEMGVLVGKGGNNIQRIKQEYFVRIDTQDNPQDDDSVIRITGAMGDLHAVHLLIERLKHDVGNIDRES